MDRTGWVAEYIRALVASCLGGHEFQPHASAPNDLENLCLSLPSLVLGITMIG